MYDLSSIDLGQDDAEYDQHLHRYFLKTSAYNLALEGKKTIIIGRKGSGKSAIFKLLEEELGESGTLIVPVTADQFLWNLFQELHQQPIEPGLVYKNIWKIILLTAAVWRLDRSKQLPGGVRAQLSRHYPDDMSGYHPFNHNNLIRDILRGILSYLKGIETPWFKVEFNEPRPRERPPRAMEDLVSKMEGIMTILQQGWPAGKVVRVLIDKLDDFWDVSFEWKEAIIIGVLKAAYELNGSLRDMLVTTVFLRSDIYDALSFNDKDKMRQYEEHLSWGNEELKKVVCERVRVSLGLHEAEDNQIWDALFSPNSWAPSEKYIIDRTFKRPRDIISFVRSALETAITNGHRVIMPSDVKSAERRYCAGKYIDVISEYKPQIPYIEGLLGAFHDCQYKETRVALLSRLEDFSRRQQPPIDTADLLLNRLCAWGVLGAKYRGRIAYSYDGLPAGRYGEYVFHPALRPDMGIKTRGTRRPKTDPYW